MGNRHRITRGNKALYALIEHCEDQSSPLAAKHAL